LALSVHIHLFIHSTCTNHYHIVILVKNRMLMIQLIVILREVH